MRIRFWRGKRQSEDDLIRDADWQAEQAKHALRDGALDHAIRWSDWTVTHTREVLARWRKDGLVDRQVTEVLADRLRDRALIHRGLGNIGEAIRDATEAIALLEEKPQVHSVENPTLVSSYRVLLSELHALADDAADALRHMQEIEAYESAVDSPNPALAHGYDHTEPLTKRIRFWKGRRQNEDDLIRDDNWQAEQAKHALRDGALDHAIRWSDWTVTHTREALARRRKDGLVDRQVTEVLADRLRDRALIHRGLGNIGEAIRDATEAITILEEKPQAHSVENAMLVSSCRVLLSELHALAGDAAAARRHGQAIEAYDNAVDWPDLALARGYDHYGWAMHLIGDPAAAPALRHAVDLYRRHDVLPSGRYTIQRFIQTVLLVADTAKPVTAAAAPEILSMLRDAATWVGRLPPTIMSPHPLLPPPQYFTDRIFLRDIQGQMAEWLEALDAPQLAEYHDRLGKFYPRGPDGPLFWSKIQQALDERGTP